ncbi:MAG: PadR family transcriptional regulator [Acidilobus sp.]
MREESLETTVTTARYRDTLVWLLLLILSEKPMHGYEIIKKIKEITANQWKPAAGSIYPLLNYMKDVSLIDVVNVEEKVRGGRKIVYALSDKGWEQLKDAIRRKVTIYMNFMDMIANVSLKALEEHGYTDDSKLIRHEISAWASRLAKTLSEG